MKGVPDHLYINFFGVEGKAAMLACDSCGFVPDELLFVAKKEFKRSPNDLDEVVLIRYTMYERQRQSKIYTLMGEKNRIIREGNIAAMWKERKRVTPDAPKLPKITKKQLQKAAEAVDTSSEDENDRVDERGMICPPVVLPPRAESDTRGEGARAPMDGSVRSTDRTMPPPPTSSASDTNANGLADGDGGCSSSKPPGSSTSMLPETRAPTTVVISMDPNPTRTQDLLRKGEGEAGTQGCISMEALEAMQAKQDTQETDPFTAGGTAYPTPTFAPFTESTMDMKAGGSHTGNTNIGLHSLTCNPGMNASTAFQSSGSLDPRFRRGPKPEPIKSPLPPPMPSLTRHPRTPESLAREVQELNGTRDELAKYGLTGPIKTKEYQDYIDAKEKEEREWKRHLAKLEAKERHTYSRKSLDALIAKESLAASSRRPNESRVTSLFGAFSDDHTADENNSTYRNADDPSPSTSLNATKREMGTVSKKELKEDPFTTLMNEEKEKQQRKSKGSMSHHRIEDPHLRQIEATKRVAILQAKVESDCFKKGLIAQEQEVPPQGTISHRLRFQELIGKAPPMETRVQTHLTAEHQKKESFKAQRALEDEREKVLTQRLDHGAVLAGKHKEKVQLIRKEVNKTKEELAGDKLKCAERRRDVDMRHKLAKVEEKRRRADEFNNQKYSDMAARRKYEHDQEALFRKKVKDQLVEMERTKKWETEKIKKLPG